MGTPIDRVVSGGFGGTGGGRARGNLATDNGEGRAETVLSAAEGAEHDTVMGDQREFDLETRVTTNGNNKTPRCFTVVH